MGFSKLICAIIGHDYNCVPNSCVSGSYVVATMKCSRCGDEKYAHMYGIGWSDYEKKNFYKIHDFNGLCSCRRCGLIYHRADDIGRHSYSEDGVCTRCGRLNSDYKFLFRANNEKKGLDLKCPNCNSNDIHANSESNRWKNDETDRWWCAKCGNVF